MPTIRDMAILWMAVTGLVTSRGVTNPGRLFTSTTTWVPTTPPGCLTETGEQLLPGQEKTFSRDGACMVCQCTYGGDLSCYYGDCMVPMCVDAEKPYGACCATCPHGRNCRIPMTGEIMAASHPVERRGMRCECPPQNFDLPGVQAEDDYTAICTHITTFPPPLSPVPP